MAESSTRTVERALQLLAMVCDAGQANLAEAARETGLSASTALRLLRTLESAGFVSRDAGGAFRPGLRLVQLGAQALSRESLVSLAEAPMRRLVAQTGESAYLSVRAGGAAGAGNGIYLAIQEGTHSVRHTSWVGRAIPLEGTAAGAALRGLAPEAGYVVVDRGVEPDVTAIAAPIAVATGGAGAAVEGQVPAPRIVGALSVVAPTYRMTDEKIRRIGGLVAAEARTLLTTTHQRTGYVVHAARPITFDPRAARHGTDREELADRGAVADAHEQPRSGGGRTS